MKAPPRKGPADLRSARWFGRADLRTFAHRSRTKQAGFAASEFDGRPGPVRDRLRDGQRAWFDELEKQAQKAGLEDPVQLVFEVHALVQGANARYQLFGERAVFARARRAVERLLPA